MFSRHNKYFHASTSLLVLFPCLEYTLSLCLMNSLLIFKAQTICYLLCSFPWMFPLLNSITLLIDSVPFSCSCFFCVSLSGSEFKEMSWELKEEQLLILLPFLILFNLWVHSPLYPQLLAHRKYLTKVCWLWWKLEGIRQNVVVLLFSLSTPSQKIGYWSHLLSWSFLFFLAICIPFQFYLAFLD